MRYPKCLAATTAGKKRIPLCRIFSQDRKKNRGVPLRMRNMRAIYRELRLHPLSSFKESKTVVNLTQVHAHTIIFRIFFKLISILKFRGKKKKKTEIQKDRQTLTDPSLSHQTKLRKSSSFLLKARAYVQRAHAWIPRAGFPLNGNYVQALRVPLPYGTAAPSQRR